MENTPIKSWIDVWTENYLGKSAISTGITVKGNYKGNNYIGWAVMERVLSQLDPDSKITLVQNENGGYVHTTRDEIVQRKQDGTTTSTVILAHFVKVDVYFMGKEFTELFPIQDNSYAAVRAYDQNDVNKAIQRAKAKVISRATGIGWALYETGDLQYELDQKPAPAASTPTPTAPKAAPTTAATKPTVSVNGQTVTAPVVNNEPSAPTEPDAAQEVYDLLRKVELSKATNVLDFINKSLEKTVGAKLTLEQTIEEFREVVNKAKSPAILLKSLTASLNR